MAESKDWYVDRLYRIDRAISRAQVTTTRDSEKIDRLAEALEDVRILLSALVNDMPPTT